MLAAPLANVRAVRGGPNRARALITMLVPWSLRHCTCYCTAVLARPMPDYVFEAIAYDVGRTIYRIDNPSPAAVEYRERRAAMPRCSGCQVRFTPRRTNQRYCEERCRLSAKRRRRYTVKGEWLGTRARCADPGCARWFRRRNGGDRRLYCSRRCQGRVVARRRRARQSTSNPASTAHSSQSSTARRPR